MDLGIQGRWALVCASSKGLGKGCAAALVAEGVNVVITARGEPRPCRPRRPNCGR
jgi:3-oxoacyl-[acyl-carrier protein] reductase